MSKRAILLIIDSFGIGQLPDANLYGDTGANTALHICENVEEVKWSTLKEFGLGNCASLLGHNLPNCEAVTTPLASFGVLEEKSAGKDTTTGHWELSGVVLDEPFHTFPTECPSFPKSLISDFENQTGHSILGNKGASGTAIIEELGKLHIEGKGVIAYTSADSVFQIAAHEDIIPIEELYNICEITRKLCDPYKVGRVIARPFTGTPGNFVRTSNRRDYSILPPQHTILTTLQKTGVETIAIGKIGDIFCERGIDKSFHDSGNKSCLNRVLTELEQKGSKNQFFFVNLVDTDMHFGHRRDIQGYHDAVQKIDEKLPEIMNLMTEDDVLLISADHGCDPSFKGTDHTREYVPLLVYKKKQIFKDLGIRQSFCDVAQSLASFFEATAMSYGKSFID